MDIKLSRLSADASSLSAHEKLYKHAEGSAGLREIAREKDIISPGSLVA
jgi:hypothetical protein